MPRPELPKTLPEQADWLLANFAADVKPLLIALRIGKTVAWVKTRFRFTVLPPQMQEAARAGRLTEQQITKLTRIVTPETRDIHFRKMLAGE